MAKRTNSKLLLLISPLRLSLLRSGKEQIVLNGQGLLHMEHFRQKVEQNSTEENPPVEGDAEAGQAPLKVENPRAWFEGDTEDDYWEETFSSWTDSKPKGGIDLICLFSFLF
jgi:alpha 1,3-glucosidase